jgi:hypothetical protein
MPKAGRRSRALPRDSQTAASGCRAPAAASGPHSTRIGPATPPLKIRPRSRKPQRWRMGHASCRSEYTRGESPSTNNIPSQRRTARAGPSRHPGNADDSGWQDRRNPVSDHLHADRSRRRPDRSTGLRPSPTADRRPRHRNLRAWVAASHVSFRSRGWIRHCLGPYRARI